MATGDEIEAGANTGANHTTRLVGEKPEDEPLVDFEGNEILEVVPLQPHESRVPSHAIDGIVGKGWNGRPNLIVVGTRGTGVVGKGGFNEGTGVLGLGSDLAIGGIGVHGIGGPIAPDVGNLNISPGPGVIGQGGRRDEASNQLRRPHGAGVIGVAGGVGKNSATNQPIPPHTETGNVGVFGQGGSAETLNVLDKGQTITTGVPVPGPGVVGRGGVHQSEGTAGAGVIGVAGNTSLPAHASVTGTGVWGESRHGDGLHGRSADGRGGVFESERSAQLSLLPRRVAVPPAQPVTPRAVAPNEREPAPELPKNGRGGDLLATEHDGVCTLWFCVEGAGAGPAKWAQVLLGPSFNGSV